MFILFKEPFLTDFYSKKFSIWPEIRWETQGAIECASTKGKAMDNVLENSYEDKLALAI